jgi:membrane protease YdiL (CAAX protease family)
LSERDVSDLSQSQRWAFVALCATAGALAVPLNGVTTAVCAAISGIVGLAALGTWRWSRLSEVYRRELGYGSRRFVEPVLWVGLGLIVGLLLLGIIRLVVQPFLPSIGARIARAGMLPAWRRLLIIYVAAVGEELVFRVFLLSAIVGLLWRLRRRPALVPSSADLWIANAASALAFGVAHLPAWVGAAPVGVWLVAAVLTLNALAGLVLGHVFVTRGIVAAIVTHAGCDCAIQLVGPLTG